jgi:hypothetical protein
LKGTVLESIDRISERLEKDWSEAEETALHDFICTSLAGCRHRFTGFFFITANTESKAPVTMYIAVIH